jgi:hypothetical protein
MTAVAIVAWCLGMSMSATLSWGLAMLDAWRGYGDQFQTGYVVGFLDAVTLAKRHDQRVYAVPGIQKPNYERWRRMVNDYNEEPANAKRPLPDAFAAVGKAEQQRMMEDYMRRQKEPTASPDTSPGSSPTADPAPTPTR